MSESNREDGEGNDDINLHDIDSIQAYLHPPRDKSRDERDAKAIEIAGSYLKLAAVQWARELLSNAAIHIDDDKIARVETILRAARHMLRVNNHDGDLIPSIQRADGSKVHPVTRLIEVMGPDMVIQADQHDDPNSRSKINKAIREARERIKEAAQQVIREGDIVA